MSEKMQLSLKGTINLFENWEIGGDMYHNKKNQVKIKFYSSKVSYSFTDYIANELFIFEQKNVHHNKITRSQKNNF